MCRPQKVTIWIAFGSRQAIPKAFFFVLQDAFAAFVLISDSCTLIPSFLFDRIIAIASNILLASGFIVLSPFCVYLISIDLIRSPSSSMTIYSFPIASPYSLFAPLLSRQPFSMNMMSALSISIMSMSIMSS